jgi:tetratricopeptide (TPR) repeat protein
MRKNAKFKYAVVLMSVLIALTGVIAGCYSRNTGIEDKNASGRITKPEPLSEKELRKFADSVRKVDGEVEAHYQLALYFQEKWRHKLAIDELKQVLLRDPAHARACNALGVSFDNLGDHEAAIDRYRLALRIDPKLDFVYNNLGYSYLLKGDNPKAVEAFRQAIALNGVEKRYRNNLGLAYVKQNNFELAYEQFSALDSEANAEKTLVKVMKDLGKDSEIGRAMLAVQLAPKSGASAEAGVAQNAVLKTFAAHAESASGIDPVARFQAMKSGMASFPGDEVEAGAEVSENPVQAEPAAEEGAETEEQLAASAQKEPLTGPVINLPPAPIPIPYETRMVAAPPKVELKELVATEKNEPVEYYHVSSVSLVQDASPAEQPQSAGRPLSGLGSKQVLVELRKMAPPNIASDAAMNQEEHEERILIAASSTKAGGWQKAPEPKQTAEKVLVEVEVANGNGMRGAAGKVADHLRRNGFSVVRVMDANSFDHLSTKVFYYGGNQKEAQRLLKAIPEIADCAELYEVQSMGSRVRLLIGKDLIQRNKTLTWGEPRSIDSRIGG